MLTMVSIDDGSEREVVKVVVAGEGNSSSRKLECKRHVRKSRERGISASLAVVGAKFSGFPLPSHVISISLADVVG